jgi:hypothetical protein
MAQFNVYRVRLPERPEEFVDVVSLLPPEVCGNHGLAGEVIAGFCTRLMQQGEKISAETFRPNRPFIDLLHEVIANAAPADPALQAAARQQQTGWVYILDARTPTPQGTVPPHDIMGAFEVRNGAIVAGSYSANQKHRLFSDDGFFKLPDEFLQDALMKRIFSAAGVPDSRPASGR